MYVLAKLIRKTLKKFKKKYNHDKVLFMGGNDKLQSIDINGDFYQQIKALARKLMAKERSDHTLSATDLVHEAFLRLSVADIPFQDLKHQYHTFARQMRRLLVNHANQKNAQKNKIDAVHLTESLGVKDEGDMDLAQIDRAIDHLENMDARSATCFELFYFTGLKQGEIADLMSFSLATLERELKYARVVIRDYLSHHR